MQAQILRSFRHVMACLVVVHVTLLAGMVHAAPYAAMVMDARNGEVIFARNHDTKLHPASLTKMMTLYVAFEAIKHGEVTLDTQFTVSRNATATSCVCLGLRPGQRISLRYLIRAAALRSANDASVVIAEGISGSVEAFAERMTRTGRAMGMSNTTFRNPHGLTQSGHVSTARDMTILGRQLYFDYPQYFNIFSRRSDHAGVATVPNTNRRFLDAYSGADGIKTGYTRAAGFNLTASAQRGGKHIIATMFGGASTAARNAHVAELLDIGFSRANARVATRAPRTPAYQGRGAVAVAQAPSAPVRNGDDDPNAAAKTIRLQLAVRKSPRPQPRRIPQPEAVPDEDILLAVRESVEAAVAESIAESVAESPQATEDETLSPVVAALAPEALAVTPRARPDTLATQPDDGATEPSVDLAVAVEVGFSIADPEDLIALEADEVAEATPDTGASPASEVIELTEVMETENPTDLQDTADAPETLTGEQVEIADATENATPLTSDIAQAPPPVRAESVSDAFAETEMATAAPLQDAQLDAETVWIGGEAAFLPDPQAPPATLASVSSLTLNADLDLPDPASRPAPNPDIILTSTPAAGHVEAERQAIARVAEATAQHDVEMVSRLSTSDGGRLWGVSLGQFNSRSAAERGLITVKMAEAAALGNGVSRIRQTSGRFEASFAGLTQTEAERACMRLSARAMDCVVASP